MSLKPHLHLESRYRKLVRDLPQTIFWCPTCKGHRYRRRKCAHCEGFGKLTKDSVQELLARPLLRLYGAHEGKFHGAGREDVDVLMLGRGRPFVYEVVGPKTAVSDDELAAFVERFHAEHGDRVQLTEPLRLVARARVGELKEAQFHKRYRLLVGLTGDLDAAAIARVIGQVMDLRQRTPQRVAHRRADLVRERRVAVLAIRQIEGTTWEVDIETDHGTYVKEWVGGDEGRTEPSLASLLGVPAECIRLDVLDILTDGGGVLGDQPATQDPVD